MKNIYCLVTITAPQGIASKKLATLILKRRLAACVNIVPLVQSHYWWKGKLESARESLLIVKTQSALVKSLMTFVKRNHPYDVPEIIALPIKAGLADYLKWISKETYQ